MFDAEKSTQYRLYLQNKYERKDARLFITARGAEHGQTRCINLTSAKDVLSSTPSQIPNKHAQIINQLQLHGPGQSTHRPGRRINHTQTAKQGPGQTGPRPVLTQAVKQVRIKIIFFFFKSH